MSRKRDPKRDALIAKIEGIEAKAAKALSGLKAKFTRFTGFTDTLRRLKRELRDHDAARAEAAQEKTAAKTDEALLEVND